MCVCTDIPAEPSSFRRGGAEATGMALPFETVSLTFRNINYFVACPGASPPKLRTALPQSCMDPRAH